jgi:hypothetical protein
MIPPTRQIDRQKTHRLIPAKFAERGDSVLARLTSDRELLQNIFELDDATNERLLAEAGKAPGIDQRELVFGIPSYSIINAAFCHAAPKGSRFNSGDRGAWYAGFEVRTSQAEVIFHRRLWLQETNWTEEDVSDYVDYLSDFHAEFHDLRNAAEFGEYLNPDLETYPKSQALAEELLHLGSAGIVYSSVRRAGGTCLVCFRPVLVTHVRRDATFRITFHGWNGTVRVVKV